MNQSKKTTNLFPSITVNAAESFVSDDTKGVRGVGGGGGGKSRREQFNFISEVVAETSPSLVYIEIKDTGVRDFFTGQPVTSSNGSGFIVKEDGLILTNAHVVINKPRASIQVRLQDGRIFAGKLNSSPIIPDVYGTARHREYLKLSANVLSPRI